MIKWKKRTLLGQFKDETKDDFPLEVKGSVD